MPCGRRIAGTHQFEAMGWADAIKKSSPKKPPGGRPKMG
jgi:hypothetical protein